MKQTGKRRELFLRVFSNLLELKEKSQQSKQLLKQKNIPFTEIRVDLDAASRDEMVARSGRRTVPQIFIDDQHVGGCDDLYALDRAGKL